MERLNAFSIALGQAEAGLTERELEKRKGEARTMAFAFMPSLRNLVASIIDERLVAEKGCLWLAFDLVPTKQMHLALDGASTTNKHVTEIIHRGRDELTQLWNEAGEFVIRTGRLTAFASALAQLDVESRSLAIESMPDEDRTAWEIMHRRAGRQLTVQFGQEALTADLPQLSLYVAEPTTRSISARISAISSNSYQLVSIHENAIDVSHAPLPSAMKMDRPRQVLESVRRVRFLLHVAEEAGLRVSLRVRVILWQSNLSPAYLEFRAIEEDASLRQALHFLTTEAAFVNEDAR